MNEKDIQIFINGAKHYFRTVTSSELSVGVPFLKNAGDTPAYSFTGIIGVSGGRRGCVYFTAPKPLLTHLLLAMGEKSAGDDLMYDLVGEVANTVSGNARAEFGSNFMISVPVVVEGELQRLQVPREMKSFVIPLMWNSYKAALVVCLE